MGIGTRARFLMLNFGEADGDASENRVWTRFNVHARSRMVFEAHERFDYEFSLGGAVEIIGQ